ncbi:MAG: hypothetical protein ABI433_10015 [Burkholderiaceae bacterium]
MTTPWLDDDEVAELCKPLIRPAARVKYLRQEGLHVTLKPNGHPIVMRSELERVFGAARLAPSGSAHDGGAEPNVTGLQEWAKRRKTNGTQAQRR